jgi:hypothetical protein
MKKNKFIKNLKKEKIIINDVDILKTFLKEIMYNEYIKEIKFEGNLFTK